MVGVAVTGYYIARLPAPVGVGAIDESGPVVYEYDRTQRLTVTRGADSAETRYEYWDTNARVAQHHPDGAITYYLGSVQATLDPATGEWVTARRTYTNGGATVASRQVTPAPVPGVGVADEVSVLLGNHQGSITTTITNNQAATRYYTPYGDRRGPDPAVEPTTTGFIGQHEDNNNLTYLNNRWHDPTTGTFTSVDPLVTMTMEAYVYGNANPIMFSDPSGLEPCPRTPTGCRDANAYFKKVQQSNTIRKDTNEFWVSCWFECFMDPEEGTGRHKDPTSTSGDPFGTNEETVGCADVGNCGLLPTFIGSALPTTRVAVGATRVVQRGLSWWQWRRDPSNPRNYRDEGYEQVPSSWGPGRPNKKGVGKKWRDPLNEGNHIRIDQGNPNSPYPSQQVNHVVVQSGNRFVGRDGTRYPPGTSPRDFPTELHIPLSEWLRWSTWFTP